MYIEKFEYVIGGVLSKQIAYQSILLVKLLLMHNARALIGVCFTILNGLMLHLRYHGLNCNPKHINRTLYYVFLT